MLARVPAVAREDGLPLLGDFGLECRTQRRRNDPGRSALRSAPAGGREKTRSIGASSRSHPNESARSAAARARGSASNAAEEPRYTCGRTDPRGSPRPEARAGSPATRRDRRRVRPRPSSRSARRSRRPGSNRFRTRRRCGRSRDPDFATHRRARIGAPPRLRSSRGLVPFRAGPESTQLFVPDEAGFELLGDHSVARLGGMDAVLAEVDVAKRHLREARRTRRPGRRGRRLRPGPPRAQRRRIAGAAAPAR